ncbi:Crp/Fnr family transcriptional regulator [Actinacidiphila paucisporea]|uniref:cAMP-binding domain of CRP or a regulatory subunit of cAMP-dependent protein kinases n=1 Tax=Actinacidiphila paucisporea TaxID=310782 RepID=A0A1M6YXH5_9ACTN|nr:Crp/Fnr family transcriptional regulator [Actinacidiphila paucisporea]SHL22986.1 cAMP-binding domain of CRP or a regulatory subunit of cAMP-dependent protein kinases [Actinacidiphila paucisporea]
MLSADLWSEILAQGSERRFRAGSVMLRQGDTGTHLLALTGGLAKVVSRDRDGTATLLAFRGPGDLLGEVAVFDGGTRIADVIALSPCSAVILEAARFRAFVEQRRLVMDLMRQAMARLRESDLLRSELLTLPLVVRLARTLVRLVDLADPNGGTHSAAVPLSMATAPLRLTGLTQEELAQSIGVTRNAVSSGLRQLRVSGAVETARREIMIKDLETLLLWAKGG